MRDNIRRLKADTEMKILNVTITVRDLATSVRFYRDVLCLPVVEARDSAEVRVGTSRLKLNAGVQFDGVHHLAFGILPSEFDRAHAWLSRRVSLLRDDGSEIIVGSTGWRSRSLYFLGPEDIILEFIARDIDDATVSHTHENPRILSISEIGIGVPDVAVAVKMLAEELAIPEFYEQSDNFAPMGNHDGLLIVVDQERIWFPTESLRSARGPLTVRIEPLGNGPRVDVTSSISITTVEKYLPDPQVTHADRPAEPSVCGHAVAVETTSNTSAVAFEKCQ